MWASELNLKKFRSTNANNSRNMTVKDALNQVGAMDEDGEHMTIQGITSEQAASLVVKLVEAMLLFDSSDAQFNQIGGILKFVANTPGYDSEHLQQYLRNRMNVLNDIIDITDVAPRQNVEKGVR